MLQGALHSALSRWTLVTRSQETQLIRSPADACVHNACMRRPHSWKGNGCAPRSSGRRFPSQCGVRQSALVTGLDLGHFGSSPERRSRRFVFSRAQHSAQAQVYTEPLSSGDVSADVDMVAVDVEAHVSDVSQRRPSDSREAVETIVARDEGEGSTQIGQGLVQGESKWRHRRKPALHEAASGQSTSSEAPVGSGPLGSTRKEDPTEEGEEEGEELEPGYKMTRVCDKLIEVFWIDKPAPEDWRKLLAYSEEWAKIRPHFFRRCEARAKEMEADTPGKAADLFRLARKLKEVDESMGQHNLLLQLVRDNEEELDGIVARRRKDFTGDFFDHVRLRCEASFRDLGEQEALINLANKILNSVEQHDRLMQDEESVEVAQTKFDDIMNSGSLEEACTKIDRLADKQQLDSTLMLMITKAWAAAKESNMMKDEVKDVMYHLYMQALGNMRMLVPKEVRILRHILSLEDPREMFAALTAAFSPGDELETQNSREDYLYTTPDKLLAVVDQVLTAYYSNRETTLIEEAKKLMNPQVIKQLEILKQVIIDEFK